MKVQEGMSYREQLRTLGLCCCEKRAEELPDCFLRLAEEELWR